MIASFKNSATEDIFNGRSTKASRNLLPANLIRLARRKLDMLNSAESLIDLISPPGNRLESLKGDRKGQHSIRINGQYRICFFWNNGMPTNVEITDYH